MGLNKISVLDAFLVIFIFVDLFVGVADVFLKFLPLEAKLLGTHHRHLSDQRPWPHLALKILRNQVVVGSCSADGGQLFGSEIVHSLSSRSRWKSRTMLLLVYPAVQR